MTVNVVDASVDMVAETNKLARQMIYLEESAADAYNRRLWTVVGELHEQRSEVQAYRSELLRHLWALRRRRRQQGYLE
jgi:hypothetical protein